MKTKFEVNLVKMISKIFSILCLSLCLTAGDEIGRSARLINPGIYYNQVMQELMYDLEERQWCNFKMSDFTQTLNEITHTNVLVAGEANYTNGFLVSVQKIEVNFMDSLTGSATVDGEVTTTATVRGRVFFRDAAIGYDVATRLNNEDHERRYTGIFTHSKIEYQFNIIKNMNTNEITVSSLLNALAGGSGVRMIYLPDDEISQVMSLRFQAGDNWDSVVSWARNIMAPKIVEIAKNKIDFPEYCFYC